MRWLFAVFLLSLCALLWAVFAIARHIRRASQKLPGDPAAALPRTRLADEEEARVAQDIH